MLQTSLTRLFGNRNQRMLRQMQKTVGQINQREADLQALDDEALKTAAESLLARAPEGAKALLPEVFALVREVSRRKLGLRHFDVQLIGGMVLDAGKIAEMKTGEGKTLVATLPATLNALLGRAVHIVTVNDYLAQRDADWMGEIYRFMGLSVGVIKSGQSLKEKQAAYACDIVYGTNNEYGFDYLRDNMAFTGVDRCQRGLDFAIIDEVDSILIDEARTPLIISGPAEHGTELYQKINAIVPKFEKAVEKKEESEGEGEGESEGDFLVDEKLRQVTLTEQGHDKAEELLASVGLLEEGGSLYEAASLGLLHHLYAALRAHHLYQREVQYLVRDGQVVIVDEFTGRMMPGRRWSDGMHQAIEAKEGVAVQQENQTLASITFQNYFRLYERLAGMTGTADTESVEFVQIYGLEVVVLPPNKPLGREDRADLIYRNVDEKYAAILDAVRDCKAHEQPVLVGVPSIEASEHIAGLLEKAKLPHQVLNARQHSREAQIIAEAGRPGSITVATNMAGRGTDIVLGGNLELELAQLTDEAQRAKAREAWQQRHEAVVAAGGLHVIGCERNESRRVDNQLRGRGGRQGDPGSSRFYLSLEDSLMRIFGSDRIKGLMEKLGMEKGEAIEHPWITQAVERAQKKVEQHNYDARKQLLEYDDVANEQRKIVYAQRNALMEQEDLSADLASLTEQTLRACITQHLPPDALPEQWDLPGLTRSLAAEFAIEAPVEQWFAEDETLDVATLTQRILAVAAERLKEREDRLGADGSRHLEKVFMLKILDEQWKEHLAHMDHLRQGIGLRGYAQKNPRQEYKREAFEMFTRMLDTVQAEVVATLLRLKVPSTEELAEFAEQQRRKPPAPKPVEYVADSLPADAVRAKVGRNAPCPCGSGKKYKHCHGRSA